MARNFARSSSGSSAVLGEGEHPGVEVEPRELAVEEPLGRVAQRRMAVAATCDSPARPPDNATPRTPRRGLPDWAERVRERRVTSGREMSTDPRFAEPTPFARLVYAHAVERRVATPASLVSMAGSLFFQSPDQRGPGQGAAVPARSPWRRSLIVAPVLGPALDRTKGGRRLFVILSAAGRACSASFMAMYISKPAPEGLLVYPLAFGVLVLAEGHRSPRARSCRPLVNDDAELVNANSRLALISAIGAAFGGAARRFAVYRALRRRLVAALRRGGVRGRGDPRDHRSRRRDARRPTTSGSRSWNGRRCTRRASCSVGARWRCCAASVGFLAFFAAFSLKGDLVALGSCWSASAHRQLRRRDRRRPCSDAPCAKR